MTPQGPNFDYAKLCQQAQIRWLKPSEVFFILRNSESLPVEEQAPEKPHSGSLFLFNRRVLRFFRKDGHIWRKKRDGKSVGEAHERLKVGNVDTLNCYYAHGERNPYFQRRSYWMLDPDYDHIVLVHYREVSKGRLLPPTFSQQPREQLLSQNFNPNVNEGQLQRIPSSVSEVYDSCQGYGSEEVKSEIFGNLFEPCCLDMINSSEDSDLSSQAEVNQALRELEEQLSLDKYDNHILEDLLPAHTIEYEEFKNPALLNTKIQYSSQKFHENIIPAMERSSYNTDANGKQKCPSLVFHQDISRKKSPSWNDMLELGSNFSGIGAPALEFEPSCYTSNATGAYHCLGSALKHGRDFQQFPSETNIFDVPFDELKEFKLQQPGHAGENAEHINGEFCTATGTSVRPISKVTSVCNEIIFDRTNTNDLHAEKTTQSSDLLDIWFDHGQHRMPPGMEPSMTVAQGQSFKISEISPEWSFSFERTKVVITGDFIHSSSYAWAVMFGDVEVPAEVIQQGVLRCQTPEHSVEKVTLYITSGNGKACSEVREFEFRSKTITSSSEAFHHVNATKNEELLLMVKFVHFLLCRADISTASNDADQTKAEHLRKSKTDEDQWLQIIDQIQAGCEISSCAMDWILQELIKDKFQQWISSKINANLFSNCQLSKDEHGIIHMISGLGYEWALNPTIDIGIGINFRDVNGWTALHWAARFGREKMAAALLASGASAGAVTNPTSQDPVGKTAGAIAASSGHKGLAGYLSEADLTSHLSLLTIEKCHISKDSNNVVESISERTAQLDVHGTEDELSLKDSLAAVRNAAQAAARIQAAFRAHSFRKRHGRFATDYNEYGMTSEEIYDLTSSTKNQRLARSHRDQKFDKAALSIQKRYRGWKGRKDFLIFRHQVVKIQAHVRGQQARKRYREFLWTVGVFEKAILRWRRGGVGLRGFRPETIIVDKEDKEDEDIVKIFRSQKVDAALDQSFSRVLAMAESPKARQQYRRMLLSFHDAKAGECSTKEAILKLQDNLERMQDDEFLYWF